MAILYQTVLYWYSGSLLCLCASCFQLLAPFPSPVCAQSGAPVESLAKRLVKEAVWERKCKDN